MKLDITSEENWPHDILIFFAWPRSSKILISTLISSLKYWPRNPIRVILKCWTRSLLIPKFEVFRESDWVLLFPTALCLYGEISPTILSVEKIIIGKFYSVQKSRQKYKTGKNLLIHVALNRASSPNKFQSLSADCSLP